MEEKNLTLVITIISCLATIAAAIIYYYTLREIKKQRQSSYRPELFIETTSFFIKVKKVNNKIQDLIWSNLEQKEDSISNDTFNLQCHNLGLGAAKNIKIKFNFNLEKFVKMINSFKSSHNILDIKENTIFNSFEFIEQQFRYSISINRNLDNNKNINFILPVSHGNKAYSFMIPKQYTLLYSSYFYLISYIDKSKIDFNIPQLFVELEYEDLYNDIHKKSFTIEFNIIAYGKEYFNGYLNIK